MSRLWLRLTASFGLTFLAVAGGSLFVISRGAAPGTTAFAAIHDPVLVRWEAALAIAVLAAFSGLSYWLARSFVEPLNSLSDQLDLLDPNNVNRKVRLADAGPEVQRLVDQANDLLSRVHVALVHLNKYSAQVAHELRTPLTVIRLKLEQAAEKIDPRLAEELETELERLTLHVERSLLLARAEQGHLQLHRAQFDLGAMLADMGEGFRLLANDQGRELRLKPASLLVDADPSYMKQILYNLFSNALRHGEGPIEARLKAIGPSARLSIGNAVKPIETGASYNLGLGNRIVDALASLHGNLQVRQRRYADYHLSRLEVHPLSRSAS